MSEFDCKTCGACCQHCVVPPFSPEELDAVDSALADPIRKMWAHAVRPDVNFWEQLGTRVCSWFNADTGECSHYDIRPKECRDFENGSGDCVSMRRRMKIDSLVALTINGE